MSDRASIENDEAKLKRYLVGEFFWEMEQQDPLPAGFAGISQESVEVLTFQGYDDMRVRVIDRVYDIHLSWRKDTPPVIREVH